MKILRGLGMKQKQTCLRLQPPKQPPLDPSIFWGFPSRFGPRVQTTCGYFIGRLKEKSGHFNQKRLRESYWPTNMNQSTNQTQVAQQAHKIICTNEGSSFLVEAYGYDFHPSPQIQRNLVSNRWHFSSKHLFNPESYSIWDASWSTHTLIHSLT